MGCACYEYVHRPISVVLLHLCIALAVASTRPDQEQTRGESSIVLPNPVATPGLGRMFVCEPIRPNGTTELQDEARICGGKNLRIHRHPPKVQEDPSTAGRQRAPLQSSCCIELGVHSARPASFGGEMNGGLAPVGPRRQ